MTALTVAGLRHAHRTPPLAERCRFGAYSSLGGDLLTDHRRLEQRLGVPLPLFTWFKDWTSTWDPAIASQLASAAYEPVIAWEAWNVPFTEIVQGHLDGFLRAFLDGAHTYPGRVILRPFHEMNGSWYPWSLAAPRKTVLDPEQFHRAWLRIADLARPHANVALMFCANTTDVGGTPMEHYWPGADHVDVIGLDGYNWGWHPDGTPHHTAEALIAPMYERLCALHPTAEFIVSEIGCAPGPGTAQWYEDLYRSTRFPRLTALAFFNQNKERDWRLDADPAALRIHRRYLPNRR